MKENTDYRIYGLLSTPFLPNPPGTLWVPRSMPTAVVNGTKRRGGLFRLCPYAIIAGQKVTILPQSPQCTSNACLKM